MNAVYPEEIFKPETGDTYRTTIAISLVRNQEDDGKARDGLVGLMKCGADQGVLDSDGRDALYYAIQMNRLLIV